MYRAEIVIRHDHDCVDVYLQTHEDAVHYVAPNEREYQRAAPGEERPVFMRLRMWEWRVIEDAFTRHAEGRLAERGTLAADVEDARRVRDRLLAIFERMEF